MHFAFIFAILFAWEAKKEEIVLYLVKNVYILS